MERSLFPTSEPQLLEGFLSGKSVITQELFTAFVHQFARLGPITLHPAKTMIGISNGHKRIAYITLLGKNFIHVVFPFSEPVENQFCFQKIAQVPGPVAQFNHHFRMLRIDDLNEEVRFFMLKALSGR